MAYKLVSSFEYDSLMKLKESLKSNPLPITDSDILDSKTLPDDLKITFFQQQKRNEYVARKQENEKPLLVKDVDKTTLPSAPDLTIAVSNQPTWMEQIDPPKPTPPLPPTSLDPPRFSRPQLKIIEYLKHAGVHESPDGLIMIDKTPVQDTNFERTIKELSNARLKRNSATKALIQEIAKGIQHIPAGTFTRGMMAVIKNVADAQKLDAVVPTAGQTGGAFKFNEIKKNRMNAVKNFKWQKF